MPAAGRASSAPFCAGKGCTPRTLRLRSGQALVDWRKQRNAGALAALAPRRRGRPPTAPAVTELARLRRENERLARDLATAETIIEIQKKVSTLLGLTRSTDADGLTR